MTCQEIENGLPAYLEDLLLPDEVKRVAEHLASCPDCSRALADLKKARQLLHGLEEVEPPPFFAQRIMSRVREEAPRKQGVLRRLFHPLYIKVPLQALAMLLVAVLAFHAYQQGEPEIKRTAPLSLPRTELGSEPAAVESPKPTSSPSVAEPAKQAPAGNMLEKDRRRSAAALQEKKEKEGMTDTAVASGQSGKAVSAPSPSRMSAAAAQERSVMNLTIQVGDRDAAIREIEERLGQVNGQIIERQHRQGSEFLKARIASEKVGAFQDLLEAIGRVTPDRGPLVHPDVNVTVVIHIVGHP